MKKIYSSPEMEIEKFGVVSSVVLTSNPDIDVEDPDTDFEF